MGRSQNEPERVSGLLTESFNGKPQALSLAFASAYGLPLNENAPCATQSTTRLGRVKTWAIAVHRTDTSAPIARFNASGPTGGSSCQAIIAVRLACSLTTS